MSANRQGGVRAIQPHRMLQQVLVLPCTQQVLVGTYSGREAIKKIVLSFGKRSNFSTYHPPPLLCFNTLFKTKTNIVLTASFYKTPLQYIGPPFSNIQNIINQNILTKNALKPFQRVGFPNRPNPHKVYSELQRLDRRAGHQQTEGKPGFYAVI